MVRKCEQGVVGREQGLVRKQGRLHVDASLLLRRGRLVRVLHLSPVLRLVREQAGHLRRARVALQVRYLVCVLLLLHCLHLAVLGQDMRAVTHLSRQVALKLVVVRDAHPLRNRSVQKVDCPGQPPNRLVPKGDLHLSEKTQRPPSWRRFRELLKLQLEDDPVGVELKGEVEDIEPDVLQYHQSERHRRDVHEHPAAVREAVEIQHDVD
mmetsp:Transcript_2671/g.6233  ORF Transcript_2671/g.6233 Transcript_2671/m.6233 type:complete len:209 (-) Transcript_2671:1331-1957(-)